jgi:hypothetical protein
MVVFHVLVPFALDHLRFRSLIHSALDRFLSWACVLLDVTYILENPPVREPTGGGNVHAPILGRVMEQENEEYFQNATESRVMGTLESIEPSTVDALDEVLANRDVGNASTSSTSLKLSGPLRLALLTVLSALATIVLSSWLLHAPIAVGRTFYSNVSMLEHETSLMPVDPPVTSTNPPTRTLSHFRSFA